MSESSSESNYSQVLNKEKETNREYRGSKDILEMSWPVLVLVQEQNPAHFREVGKQDGKSFLDLDKPLHQHVLQDLSRVYYEPYLIVPRNPESKTVNDYLDSEMVEKSGEFGPYKVYRVKNPEKNDDDTLVFGSRKKAAEKIGDILPENIPYSQPDIDRKPQVPESDEKPVLGIKRVERDHARDELERLFDEKFIQRLKETQNIADYPKQMQNSLRYIVKSTYNSYQQVMTDLDWKDKTLEEKSKTLQWEFAQRNLIPLEQYLDYRLERDKKSPSEELVTDLGEVLVDYDYVIETMKLQADMLIGEQKKPFHGAFLIPKGYIHGAKSGEVELHYSGENLVIEKGDKSWEFPLPERNENGEVAIKGGVARLITKVILGLPAEDEIPPNDLDLVTFGKKNAFSMEQLRERFGVEERDVERIKGDNIFEYMGDRDQSINEILFTENGLVISMNALSAYFQRTTEASADPVRNIYGEHVLNVNRNYFDEFSDVADYFLINGARFPTPRALGRMYKFLIEGKTDSVTIPEGSLKMDIGSVHWLVMARKLLNVEDSERKDELLGRMVKLAGMVGAKQFRDEFLDNKDGPYRFVSALLRDFKKMSNRDFDMDSQLSEKETLDWIASRFARQVMTKFDRYYGYKKEASFSRRLTAKDMLPTQIVLPREEDLVYDDSYKNEIESADGIEEEEFDWKEVRVEEILGIEIYQKLYDRMQKVDYLLLDVDDWPSEDRDIVRARLLKEKSDAYKEIINSRNMAREFEYFEKFKNLEQVKKQLDPGLYPFLLQFNLLPLRSVQSCTEHVIPGTNRLDEVGLPILNFEISPKVSQEEKEIQFKFLREITSLNIRISERLGIMPYNVLAVRGYLDELPNGKYRELSMWESIDRGLDLAIELNIPPDSYLRENYGREVLLTVWEEFYNYVNSFLPLERQKPLPDYKYGEIFIKRKRH